MTGLHKELANRLDNRLYYIVWNVIRLVLFLSVNSSSVTRSFREVNFTPDYVGWHSLKFKGANNPSQ